MKWLIAGLLFQHSEVIKLLIKFKIWHVYLNVDNLK